MLIEIRSNKSQTVVPGSVHTSGEIIEFHNRLEPDKCKPSEVDAEIIIKAVRKTAAATLLYKHYPKEGSRHNFWLTVSPILLKSGMTADETSEFVFLVADKAGDEEAHERCKIPFDTEQRIINNLPVYGIPTLKEYLSEKEIKNLCKFLDYKPKSKTALVDTNNPESEDFFEYLNKRYAYIVLGGKPAILVENGNSHTFISKAAFKGLYTKHHYVDKGNKIYITDVWFSDLSRRTFKGLQFAINNPDPEYYNTWKGFAVKPVQGSWNKLQEHILNNICNGNKEHYNYLIGWMAFAVQHPDKKTGTAIAIKGKQGTGKSLFVSIFGSLFGIHYKVISNSKHVTGNFNSQVDNCIIVHLEEGFFAGDKSAEAILKELITGNKHLIEYKGKDPIEVPNYVKLMITSNSDWLVPAGERERRFFVLEVSDNNIQDHAYFEAISQEAENGGREAMLYDLLNHDLSTLNLRQIPYTKSLLQQKIASLDINQKWYLDLLLVGELPGQIGWSGTVGIRELHDDYVIRTNKLNYSYKSTITQLGMFMNKYVEKLQKSTGDYVIDDMGSYKNGAYYILPDLKSCRTEFESRIGQKINWDEI